MAVPCTLERCKSDLSSLEQVYKKQAYMTVRRPKHLCRNCKCKQTVPKMTQKQWSYPFPVSTDISKAEQEAEIHLATNAYGESPSPYNMPCGRCSKSSLFSGNSESRSYPRRSCCNSNCSAIGSGNSESRSGPRRTSGNSNYSALGSGKPECRSCTQRTCCNPNCSARQCGNSSNFASKPSTQGSCSNTKKMALTRPACCNICNIELEEEISEKPLNVVFLTEPTDKCEDCVLRFNCTGQRKCQMIKYPTTKLEAPRTKRKTDPKNIFICIS